MILPIPSWSGEDHWALDPVVAGLDAGAAVGRTGRAEGRGPYKEDPCQIAESQRLADRDDHGICPLSTACVVSKEVELFEAAATDSIERRGRDVVLVIFGAVLFFL